MENLERYLNALFPVLQLHLFGNALSHWAVFLATWVIMALLCVMVRTWVLIRLKRLNTKKPAPWKDDLTKLVQATGWPFLVASALFLSSSPLEIKGKIIFFSKVFYSVIVFIQAAVWTNVLVTSVVSRCFKEEGLSGKVGPKQTIIGFLAKGVLFTSTALVLLDNLNVNVSALVAGLGVGGVAVALAIRNILGDLFSSLSILLDKPFSVGDSLVLGDYQGTVEKVGLKTTRIRSVTGELIIVPNSDILQSRVRNYRTIQKRRGVLKFTLGFSTPSEDLRRLSDNLPSVFEGLHKTTLTRAHFTGISQVGFEFEAVYTVDTADHTTYMDICQTVNLRTVDLVSHLGLKMGPQPLGAEAPPGAPLEALAAPGGPNSTRALPQEGTSPATSTPSPTPS